LGFLLTPWAFTTPDPKSVKKHDEMLELTAEIIRRVR